MNDMFNVIYRKCFLSMNEKGQYVVAIYTTQIDIIGEENNPPIINVYDDNKHSYVFNTIEDVIYFTNKLDIKYIQANKKTYPKIHKLNDWVNKVLGD